MRLETRLVRFKATGLVKSLENLRKENKEGQPDEEEALGSKTVIVWMAPIGGKSFLPALSEEEPDPSSSSSCLRDSPSTCSDRLYARKASSVGSPTYSSLRSSSSSDGGVATFCDWSHGKCRGGEFVARSVSALSPRTVPVLSAEQNSRRSRLKQWRNDGCGIGGGGGGGGAGGGGGGGAHFHVKGFTASGPNNSFTDTSRMFTRQKTAATKGEKEIMMGICQNRGDIAPDSYANCPDCLMSSYGLMSHRDAWSFGKVRQSSVGLFPPVSISTVNNGINIYHRESSPKRSHNIDEATKPFTRQQQSQQQQQLHQNSSNNIGNNDKAFDSCLVCSRPKLSEQETPARPSHSSNGKVPPPPTPVFDIDNDNFHLESRQKQLSKPVPRMKREKTKVKPKLLLNVHLPRVPQSSMRMGEENDMDTSEDKIRKHMTLPRQHMETR